MYVLVSVYFCNAWLVNTTSQDRHNGYFLFLVYGFIILRVRTLLFLVPVRGRVRSTSRSKTKNTISLGRKHEVESFGALSTGNVLTNLFFKSLVGSPV